MIALAALALAPGFSEFLLQDLEGARHTIRASSARATVVVFISTVCPISQEYDRRYQALYARFSPSDVRFVFVYSNRNEPVTEIREHARTGAFPFPVYRDPDQSVADLFQAAVTPTAAVVDEKGRLVYRGRIDDSVNRARVKDRSLENALVAVLAGKAVRVPETRAFG